jgi:bifunctional UDP-N-acetylglucosamine pyrophosphorylase / glucosamine-1-phosphate N-acetyltransferase
MSPRPLLVVVLAAGKGTRMRSQRPKVLHQVAGRSMLGHVIALGQGLEADKLAVVIGPGMDDVRQEALGCAPKAEVYVQAAQRGTADALLAADAAIAGHDGDVVVLYGDTPLLQAETIGRLRAALDSGAGLAVLGFEAADPTGYGRLLRAPDATLAAIREERDATPAERRVRLCNSGVFGFRLPNLSALLKRIGNDNAKGEFYLTDIVELARAEGARGEIVACSEAEVLGINSREHLAAAEAVWQARARAAVMAGGATLIAPDTVFLSFDTRIGMDVTIEPNVFFAPGVTVEDGAEIKANCYFEKAIIRRGARVGPFARLRPGADLGESVHIGNFVEVKNASLGKGAKANHLAYIGDATVGPGANVGAGTIVCNYDGFFKHKTEIGPGAFIGSNTSLVAPVTIGEGAYIGSGSVITRNVAPGALALERAEQQERPGWAARFREMMARRKAKAAQS